MTHRHHNRPSPYLLVCPFEHFPGRFGTHAHPFPQHISLVPEFECPTLGVEQELLGNLEYFCGQHEPFTVTLGAPRMYDTDDSVLAQPLKLHRRKAASLHAGLVALVVGSGCTIIGDPSTVDVFSPHVTVGTSGERFPEHIPIEMSSVLPIARFAKGFRAVGKTPLDGFCLGKKPQ